MAMTQDGRVARIDFDSGIPRDKVCLARYDITEGLSELFEWRAEVVSEDPKINFESVLGKGCTITHESYSTTRYYHARLIEAQNAGLRGRYYVYNLVFRPWLWLLSRTTDCVIYADMTVDEIITQVFQRNHESGLYEFRLENMYTKREYTVQYRETDLAFVSRLMEEEGIFYFFEHQQGSHNLVLTDSKSGYSAIPGFSSVPLRSIVGAEGGAEEHLFDWHSERRTRSKTVVTNDYNFKAPGQGLLATKQAKGIGELYDHPVNYKDLNLGFQRATVRLEAEQAFDNRRYANGDAAPLFPGAKIKLTKHADEAENKLYCVVRATHSYVTEAYESSNDPNAANDAYDGTYEFLPYDHPFRAPQITPRPLVYGMHTGRVCGPSGQEIWVDEHGRILVEYFWDRNRGYNSPATHSRWTRVAQLWAGSNWGAQFIPRIGMEVVIAYEEGDPDHPIVIGCVYNGDNRYPYPMAENGGDQRTQSGLKSNSTIGGGGYNEFMFEDRKGEEFIRMHAQKDHKVTIRNSETWDIGRVFSPVRGSPSRETTIQNGDDKLTIKKGDQSLDILEGSRRQFIKSNYSTNIGGNEDRTVTGTISVHSDQKIHIDAVTEIKLTVGGNTIKIDNSGITINGVMVRIN